MSRFLTKWFGPGLTTLGLCAGSGCSNVEDWFQSCCESDCPHHHAHASAPDEHESPACAEHDDDHTHIGPNGAPLIILGEHEYHAELNIDHSRGSATVLLLDHSGRRPYPVPQDNVVLNLLLNKRPHQVKLVASPQPTDPPSASSRFVGQDPILREPQKLRGRLNIVIDGKPYTGAVARLDEQKLLR